MPRERTIRGEHRILTLFVGFAIAGLVASTCAGAGAESPEEDASIQWSVELRDGSKLIGSTETEELPLRASFGKVELPTRLIDTIEFSDDKETATVNCTNGDRLVGVIETEALKLKTSFGVVKIPLSTVQRVSIRVQTQTSGLMLHYSFDKDEGAIVTDQSGLNHVGRVNGATFASSGVRGGAMRFDGMDDTIQIGDLGRLESGTLCFWVNAEEYANWRNPFTTESNGGDHCIRFESAWGGRLGFSQYTYSNSLETGTWYHVVLAWSPRKACGYLDGETKFAMEYDTPPFNLSPVFRNVALGHGYSREPMRHWKGMLDEVRIYNTMLGAADIRRLYDEEARGVRISKKRQEQDGQLAVESSLLSARRQVHRSLEDDLALYYNFDSFNGETLLDGSRNERQGKAAGIRIVPGGRIGNAASFDGSAWISAGDVLDLDSDESSLTVSVWIKAPPVSAPWTTFMAKQQLAHPYTGWALHLDPLGEAFPQIISRYPQTLDAVGLTLVCDNRWHHLVAEYEVSSDRQRIVLFVDGKLADISERPAPPHSVNTSAPLTIGKRMPEDQVGFVGVLDELRIYTRSLSAKEVAELYAIRRGK